MTTRCAGATLLTTAALTLTSGDNRADAQAAVMSAGAALVRSEVLHKRLTAAGGVDLYDEPRRSKMVPLFWARPAKIAEIAAGEEVVVTGIMETFVWHRRFVWLEVQRTATTPTETPTNGWIELGTQLLALNALRAQWTETPPTVPDAAEGEPGEPAIPTDGRTPQ